MRRLAVVIGLALGLQAAPAAAQDGPFLVYFEPGSDALSARAKLVLDSVAGHFHSAGSMSVNVSGHTDRAGDASVNIGLSQRRANEVRAYLSAVGVPDGSMTTEAFGETRPAVETADGVRRTENNRVEITFGPGSGW